MVHDFIDHDRTNPRSCVRRTQRVLPLRRVLNLAGANRVTPEGKPVGRGAKAEPIAETGKIAGGIGREQIYFFAVRIEQEARWIGWIGIEIRFGKYSITTGRDRRAHGDVKLLRHRARIREVPVADVHVERVRIVQFD